jgi:hypothetical protein
MSRKQAIVPADVQRRARRIAVQASKLADQARPMTKTAKRGAGAAAEWAKPRIGSTRAWMGIRVSRGGVAVQDTIAPKVGDIMAAAARKLDPPKRRSLRLPMVLAGTALLAAGAAAAAAMAMRNKRKMRTMPPAPMPSRTPSAGTAGQPTVLDPAGEPDRPSRESDVNGLSRTL